MYVFAILYSVILAAIMLVALWQDRSYGGGNHWVHFGSALDRLIQSIGLIGLLALAFPPGLAAVLALLRGNLFWAIALVAVTLALVGVIYAFAVMALD